MTFKNSSAQFQMLDVKLLDPDSNHARKSINEETIKGLANSIRKVGIIHPLVVRPGITDGRYTVVVGERRRQAAIQAEEQSVPVIIRTCAPDQTLEVQVFENIGLGVRSALEPRDMANAIQSIATRFATPEEAAQHFGRAPTWLGQATAAANLSEKVSALLDSGKITSTSAAVQLEKLTKKNEAKADSLINQIEQLPEGEKVSKKVVDHALAEETGRARKREETKEETQEDTPIAGLHPDPHPEPPTQAPGPDTLSMEVATTVAPKEDQAATDVYAPAPQRSKVNPGKVKRVAELLGLSDEDEEDILVRLIDEFLALKEA